jgi:hypothetical protein
VATLRFGGRQIAAVATLRFGVRQIAAVAMLRFGVRQIAAVATQLALRFLSCEAFLKKTRVMKNENKKKFF